MPRTPKTLLLARRLVYRLRRRATQLAKGKDNKAAAEDELLRLRHKQLEQNGKARPDMTVLQMIDLFLDAVKIENSEHTYTDYHRWLHEFAKRLFQKGSGLVVRSTLRAPSASCRCFMPKADSGW